MNKTVEELARWLRRKPESLSPAESRVLQSTIDHKTLTRNVNDSVAKGADFGQRVADGIARVGGSWTFIIGFLVFLAIWTAANAWLLGRETFDPYPFIFLNLLLSMLAALQAPVIMMSQNRQAERDRIDAAHDYEVNLKAEIEIMALHEKLDELRHKQILGMREQIQEIADRLAGIDVRIAGGPAAR